MSHGVHAATQRVEPAELHSMLDGARADAEVEQLRARHDTMLALGERRDGRL